MISSPSKSRRTVSLNLRSERDHANPSFFAPGNSDIFAKVLVFRPVVILYFYLFAEATAVQHDNQAGQQSGNDDGFHPVAIKNMARGYVIHSATTAITSRLLHKNARRTDQKEMASK